MLKILMHGAGGRMCRAIATYLPEDMTIVAGVDERAAALTATFSLHATLGEVTEDFDMIVDFSRPDALPELLECARTRGAALVLATTGYSNEDLAQIERAARLIPIFQSANLSIGVHVLTQLVARVGAALYPCDMEIVEKHHRTKLDAPSGTALTLAHALREATGAPLAYAHGRSPQSPPRGNEEIGIHALRGGTVVGEHSVFFFLNDEVIEIKHSAQSRDVFAHGAIRAMRFLADQQPGLYGMQDLIGLSE